MRRTPLSILLWLTMSTACVGSTDTTDSGSEQWRDTSSDSGSDTSSDSGSDTSSDSGSDTATGARRWYVGYDSDGDGFAPDTSFVEFVGEVPPPQFVSNGGDCDDTDSAIYPGALELDCLDPIDRDCDGFPADCATTCADGWLGASESDVDCGGPCSPCADGHLCNGPDDCMGGYCTTDSGVCAAPTVEDPACAGLDANGDGIIEPSELVFYYVDKDGDGHGLPTRSVAACESPPGFAPNYDDCDDNNPARHPGALELDCLDRNDYNCDGHAPYCTETCSDGLLGGSETDVDCSGPCGACGEGQRCLSNMDCASRSCSPLTQTCEAASPCAYPPTLAGYPGCTNIALGALTWSNAAVTPTALAVDGDRCTAWNAGTPVFSDAFLTLSRALNVDFGAPRWISAVTVVLNIDVAGGDPIWVEAEVAPGVFVARGRPVPGPFLAGDEVTLPIDPPMYTQVVVVRTPGTSSLREVGTWECPNPPLPPPAMRGIAFTPRKSWTWKQYLPLITETQCDDGVDEDTDGLVDCEDGDCMYDPACGAEQCGNHVDDDGDALVDCEDDDCFGPSCVGATVTRVHAGSGVRKERPNINYRWDLSGTVAVLDGYGGVTERCTWLVDDQASYVAAYVSRGWLDGLWSRTTREQLSRANVAVNMDCSLQFDDFLPGRVVGDLPEEDRWTSWVIDLPRDISRDWQAGGLLIGASLIQQIHPGTSHGGWWSSQDRYLIAGADGAYVQGPPAAP